MNVPTTGPGSAASAARARVDAVIEAAGGVLRLEPSWVARGAHSSQTVRRRPAARKTSGCSPRNSRRSQTSQATSGWEVTIVRVAIGTQGSRMAAEDASPAGYACAVWRSSAACSTIRCAWWWGTSS